MEVMNQVLEVAFWLTVTGMAERNDRGYAIRYSVYAECWTTDKLIPGKGKRYFFLSHDRSD